MNVRVVDGRARAVVLKAARRFRRAQSSRTPTRGALFLKLVDPTDLDPNFLMKVRGYRSLGAAAKVNLALDRLPSFGGAETPEKLSGASTSRPEY